MKINDIIHEDGKIVKGVNTTVDVQPGETERQAAKFFGHGMPKELHKKARKNSDPNTLYNLGLAEGLEEEVKQSHVIKVVNNLASRRDNNPFPVKFSNGVTIGVRPSTARRILNIFDNATEEMKSTIMRYITTANGFKELVQKAGIKENQVDEDLGSMPPLVDLIVMAVLAKTSVDVIKGALIAAYKTGKGMKKLKSIAKQAGVHLSAKFEDVNESSDTDYVVKAALEAMKRLSDSQGTKHSIGDYAFSISRAFNLPISIRELVKKYNETY